MFKKTAFSLLLLSILSSTAFVASAGHSLKSPHQQAGLECSDCHKNTPPKRKASQKACRSCHSDMKDAAASILSEGADRKVEMNIHDTHVGDLRCTVCHSAHRESKLYCNDACHHKFDLKTP